MYSASRRKEGMILHEIEAETSSLWRGFFTSFLNPKGLLMYLAILPQFISLDGNTAVQALVLSALFILGCGLVYSLIGIITAKAYEHSISDGTRRRFETIAGFMLIGAAVKLAIQAN